MSEQNVDQAVIFAVLAGALVLFVWGRWRYDVVAVGALLIATLAGVVPSEDAFSGFGHPAVITVAAVLVLSRGLAEAGVVTVLADWLLRIGKRPGLHLGGLIGAVAILSMFMNNVGALALLLPVAVRLAREGEYEPSRLLMPLGFASLLGGLTTMIGTPPNIIIGTFRAESAGAPFAMFDFFPVGGMAALAGLAFLWLASARLVPVRRASASQTALFRIEDYLSEATVTEESSAAWKTVAEIEEALGGDIVIAGIVRRDRRLPAPAPREVVAPGDRLIIRADPAKLAEAENLGLSLATQAESVYEGLSSGDAAIVEAVILPTSALAGRTAAGLQLRRRYAVNVLGVSRAGAMLREELSRTVFRPGDILLVQGPSEALMDSLHVLGLVPLAERELRIGQQRRVITATVIFAAAIGVAVFGPWQVQVAFGLGAMAMILAGILSLKDVYDAVDWPIIVLLGAMIPVGGALESTGGAERVGELMLNIGDDLPPALTLAVLILITMLMTEVVNNAAAAVLMAPIAVQLAEGLQSSPDPFLMGVAVGASCSFLTPIGHQSNTLVMGPGGYRFGDYWRLGLPLQTVVFIVAFPAILLVWPLS